MTYFNTTIRKIKLLKSDLTSCCIRNLYGNTWV